MLCTLPREWRAVVINGHKEFAIDEREFHLSEPRRSTILGKSGDCLFEMTAFHRQRFRNSTRRSFPVAVFGRLSTNSISRGYL